LTADQVSDPKRSRALAAADARLDSEAMSDDQLAEAKRYGRRELWCHLIDKAIDIAYLSLVAFLFARPLDAWLADPVPDRTLRLAVFFLIVIGGHVLVSFPLSLYSGFLLEHQFELSNLTFRRWLWRYTKSNLLVVCFGLLLVVGVYWLIWLTESWWWLVAAGAFFVVSIVLGQIVPTVILPLFYKSEKISAPELSERLGRLAEGTGLTIEGVYRMDMSEETVKANAMLAGVGRSRRVLLGDSILGRFTPEEIEVVFAHEIGHHVHRHIYQMLLLGAVLSAAVFWVCDWVIRAAVSEPGVAFDYDSTPIWSLAFLMLTVTLVSNLLEPLQNLVSRHFERQCDRYALERTGDHESYRTAFRKLSKLNKDDPDPHPVEVFLFHSHPPISDRLAMADGAPSEERIR